LLIALALIVEIYIVFLSKKEKYMNCLFKTNGKKQRNITYQYKSTANLPCFFAL